MNTKFVDEIGAAAYLGVSARTLRRWRMQGTGPAFYKVGGRVWYTLSDLAIYVGDCRHE